MIKRYLLTFAGFLLLALIYLLSLLPLLLVRADLATANFVQYMTAWGILVMLSLGPALSLIIKKIWFFQGEGPAIALNALQSALLAINEMSGPVRLRKKGKRLIAEWRYDDPKWCECMADKNMVRTYELHLTFDDTVNTARLADRSKKIDLSLCPIRVRTGFFAMPRLFFNIKTGKDNGLEQLANPNPNDFHFKPREIKTPLVNALLDHGWNVRFSLF